MSQPPAFQIDGLRRGYGGGWRLDLPELEVGRAEFLAILGPTGAGKSTLLRLLHFLDAPEAGRVDYEGKPIPFPAPLEIRRSIGMIFQRPLMVSGSVRDNVAFGLRVRGQHDPRRVDDLLTRFDDFSVPADGDKAIGPAKGRHGARAFSHRVGDQCRPLTP